MTKQPNHLFKLPKITTPDKKLRLFHDEIFFTEKDLAEAGNAFGAFRVVIKTELCDGISCRKCKAACPKKTFDFSKMLVKKETSKQSA